MKGGEVRGCSCEGEEGHRREPKKPLCYMMTLPIKVTSSCALACFQYINF